FLGLLGLAPAVPELDDLGGVLDQLGALAPGGEADDGPQAGDDVAFGEAGLGVVVADDVAEQVHQLVVDLVGFGPGESALGVGELLLGVLQVPGQLRVVENLRAVGLLVLAVAFWGCGRGGGGIGPLFLAVFFAGSGAVLVGVAVFFACAAVLVAALSFAVAALAVGHDAADAFGVEDLDVGGQSEGEDGGDEGGDEEDDGGVFDLEPAGLGPPYPAHPVSPSPVSPRWRLHAFQGDGKAYGGEAPGVVGPQAQLRCGAGTGHGRPTGADVPVDVESEAPAKAARGSRSSASPGSAEVREEGEGPFAPRRFSPDRLFAPALVLFQQAPLGELPLGLLAYLVPRVFQEAPEGRGGA